MHDHEIISTRNFVNFRMCFKSVQVLTVLVLVHVYLKF